jgi:hypothetical protein
MIYNLDNQEERNLYAMSNQEKEMQGFIPSFYGRKGMWIDEGDDYYTIDNDEVVWSCWDDESVKLHKPNRKYFATEEEAQMFLDDCKDIAIRIVSELVLQGYVKDCTDTDDQTEFEIQDIIVNKLLISKIK